MNHSCEQSLDALIEGILAYLVEVQEDFGPYAGAFWSELAYHIPHFDYHAGGSHHNRTAGSAGLAFVKMADKFPQWDLRRRAERAYDWCVTRQDEDGGMFEITNNEKPSQFHLPYERSAISLGMVVQGLSKAFEYGLPRKPAYVNLILKAARWQMTVEVAPGNFLHSEGYPKQYLILNAVAHAAETLYAAARLTNNEEERIAWGTGAERAVAAILAAQRPSGMYPYRFPDENQDTISYTATCAWVLQNLVDAGHVRRDRVDVSLTKAGDFLADSVDAAGHIRWDGREVHGQKHHTWVYGMTARCLAWFRKPMFDAVVQRMISFVHHDLHDPKVRLPRLYDFPVGEQRVICDRVCEARQDYACAFNQADMLDYLVDVRRLTVRP